LLTLVATCTKAMPVTTLWYVCLVYIICIRTFLKIDNITEYYIFIVRLCVCHGQISKATSLDLSLFVVAAVVLVVVVVVVSSSFGYCFLVRDSIYAIARSLLTPVRPSVPLSVTRVDQSKTVTVRSRNLHHSVAP